MAGTTAGIIGSHISVPGPSIVATTTLTEREVREIVRVEDQDTLDVLGAMLMELQRIALGMQVGTENELEVTE